MKKVTVLAAITTLAGFALIGSAALLDQARLGSILSRRSVPSTEVQSAHREFETVYGCAVCLLRRAGPFVRQVVVNAPREMRIDESTTVKFIYSDRTITEAPEQSSVSFNFNVVLSGANFDVKPSEAQKILAKQVGQGPTSLAWTVKPKGTGSHALVLDFAELGLTKHSLSDVVKVFTRVPGKSDEVTTTDTIVELPITVLSEWNLPVWIVNIVKATFGLVGFIFVTPGVWWFVRQVRARGQRSGTPSEDGSHAR